ncbi:TPA: hypothetical protein DCF80_03660 [Candidatus Saccharibacteria bacterium]|nr:hypothetical protein [Candidatus Saccharibacteria bacterium]HRK40708.1 NUDIX domain-containing protein [Candidatus Saccharibacteria bacterium]
MIEHYTPDSTAIEVQDGKLRFPETGTVDAPTPEESLALEAKGLQLDSEGRPLHPELARVIGEHGIRLGLSGFWHSWGPNYTADPLVLTPWPYKIALIRRKDNGKLALPGGFVDESDGYAQYTAIRELDEETGLNNKSGRLFNVETLYQGPVRDDRETIHAWPETTAVYMETDKEYLLTGADDAIEDSADWYLIDDLNLDELHGSHGMLVRMAVAHAKDKALGRR